MTKQSTAGHTELLVGLKWHPRSVDGCHNGSIYYEKFPGHAYAVAMQPHYVTGEQWKFYAESIVTAVNTYPAVTELVEALEACQASLALMIEPNAIKSSSVMGAFTQAFEADCKARSALTHYRELAGTSNEGAK